MAIKHRNNIQREIQWLLEEKYSGKRTGEAEKDIARLEKGEHIDYVTGWSDFLGCKIDLSQKPFIPRPETEYWVEKVVQDIRAARFPCALPHISPAGSTWAPTRLQKTRSTHVKCLDIFAGSGCIGIAILKHIPRSKVDFAEKEKKFLRQIRINAQVNGIEAKRYRVIQSDIFSNIKGKYDYILANPPYVAESRKKNVQKTVLENEPLSAVFGGKNGLKFIKKFLREAKNHLRENGKIYMEFDAPQKKEIERLLRYYGYQNFEIAKDQYGKWRYAKI